jgi:hypothetical protein
MARPVRAAAGAERGLRELPLNKTAHVQAVSEEIDQMACHGAGGNAGSCQSRKPSGI